MNNLIKTELKEIKSISVFLNNEDNELDKETLEDTKESVKMLLEQKSEQLELIFKELETKEKKCKEISDFYYRKSVETKEKNDALKKIIMEIMENLGTKKIETITGSFTVRKNQAALVIDDESLIPNQFITIVQTNKIEKNEIKKAIKNGEDIAGVHFENSESLLIK